MAFETLVYSSDGPIATITLNRPNELNTIVPPCRTSLKAAINLAVKDPSIKVIILRGAGRSFCAGYDFSKGFHLWDRTYDQWRVGCGKNLPGAHQRRRWRQRSSEHVARAKAGYCAGARLVRRRRRYCALCAIASYWR